MKLALLGYPLSHSVSPAMHNAALEASGLHDWRYQAMPAPPERLAEAVAAVRSDEYAGANVTVPHKEAVAPLLDGLTPLADAIGAVNTLVKRDGRLIGHNTDAAGLLADLHAHGASAAEQIVLVLGAGGAARAVVAACAGVGAEIRVLARRRVQAEALRAIVPGRMPQPAPNVAAKRTFDVASATLEIFDWTPLGFLQASDDCSLIVNTTPLGLAPCVDASPWLEGTPFPPEAFVYDLVYNPAETALVRQARAEGLRAATGLGMLVEQGALAFEQWTGLPAPRGVMRGAAERELNVNQVSNRRRVARP